MADLRKKVKCSYCEEKYHLKHHEDSNPRYCSFCAEEFADFNKELEEEEPEEIDYSDDDDN